MWLSVYLVKDPALTMDGNSFKGTGRLVETLAALLISGRGLHSLEAILQPWLISGPNKGKTWKLFKN